jgi:predicted nucleic acid-binding protein
MGQQYLIDSKVVIDYLAGKFTLDGMLFINEIVNDIPFISVITKIEILGYKSPEEANQLLSDFVDDSVVIELTEDVVLQTIELRKELKIKTPDAIIAATAMVNQLVLLTRNKKDFDKINGIEVVNPYDI